MSNAPWYLKASADEGPSLKHHKAPGKYNAAPSKLDQRFARGVKAVSLVSSTGHRQRGADDLCTACSM